MATLIIFERHTLVVLPARHRHLILVLEERCRRLSHATSGHLDDHRHAIVQRIARLGIFLRVEHRLQLVSGRRLHIVHIALGCRFDAHRGIIAPIGRERAPGRIVIGRVAIGGQRMLLSVLPHPQVVVAMKHLHLAVGRHPHAVLLVGHLHPVALSSLPLWALSRLLRILSERGHRVLVGIHLLIYLFLTIEHRVPELVRAMLQVHVHVAILHLVRVFRANGEGSFVVVFDVVGSGRLRQHQGQSHGQCCSYHYFSISFSWLVARSIMSFVPLPSLT